MKDYEVAAENAKTIADLSQRLADVTLLAQVSNCGRAEWFDGRLTVDLPGRQTSFPCQFHADGLPILTPETRAALTAAKGGKR